MWAKRRTLSRCPIPRRRSTCGRSPRTRLARLDPRVAEEKIREAAGRYDISGLEVGAGETFDQPELWEWLLALNARELNVPVMAFTSGLSRLGAAGADTRGFPNGRRLFDDVVDIEERYVLNGLANLNGIPFGDGVDGNDVPYQTAFPYVPIPRPGSEAPANPHRIEPAR